MPSKQRVAGFESCLARVGCVQVDQQRAPDSDVLAMTGMGTLELVSRLQRSDLDQATLDLEGAVSLGMRALEGDRESLPSLLMVSRDLTQGSQRPLSRRDADAGLPRSAHVPGQRQLRTAKPGSALWSEFPCLAAALRCDL